MTVDASAEETPDPSTAERVRVQKEFEKTMDKHGLLDESGGVKLEPEQIKHDTPPGTEQTAG
jgi:hypothetical protein